MHLAVRLRHLDHLRAHQAIRVHVTQERLGERCHTTLSEFIDTCLLIHGSHTMPCQSIPPEHLGEADVFRLAQTTQAHVRFEQRSLSVRRIDHVQPLSHRQVVVLGPQPGLALRVMRIRHESLACLTVDREELLRESIDDLESLCWIDWFRRGRESVGAGLGFHHRNRRFDIFVQSVAGQLAVYVWLAPG